MKALLLIWLVLPVSTLIHAQTFAWVKQTGGPDHDVGQSIAKDASGNIYTTGYFTNTVDFDPGPGVFNLTAATSNIFISKSDANGNFIWAKHFANSMGTAYGTGITVDNLGNIYATGTFDGTVDFDPGPTMFNVTANTMEIFALKLDAAGNLVWAKQLGESYPGSGSQGRGSSLAVDQSGNVFIAGTYHGVGDFDPGTGTIYIGTSSAAACAFITKLDVDGNLVWVRNTEGGIFAPDIYITLDNAGDVYATGGFNGITDFDPGPASSTLTSTAIASTSIFIFKWMNNGNFSWAKMMAGGPGYGASIAADNTGNICSTGKFAGTVDFDPGPGTYEIAYTGTANIYISRLTLSGSFNGALQFGGNSDAEGSAIALDNSGNVYITGMFSGTVDFEPGTPQYNLTALGSSDIFVARINVVGHLDWAVRMGGTGVSRANAMILDAAGNVYTTGLFNSSTDFDFGLTDHTLNSNGGMDMFIHKIHNCTASTHTITANACTSYTLNGQTYTTSGTYIQTLTNTIGCDSTITLILSIGAIQTFLDVTTCDSYTWNGKSYTNSGIYKDTLPNINGCDSIITLNLVLNQTIRSGISAVICKGENYAGHTSTGIYTDIYAGMNGCDSIRVLNLTVKNSCLAFAIPNAFTPNNDGRNDIFRPTITIAFSNYSFTVFNRLGQKVFETKKYPGGWDGTFKGKPQPDGSYIYYISYMASSGLLTEEKGTFILIR